MPAYFYNPMMVVLPGGPVLPPVAANGDQFYLDTGDTGVYVCGGSNVWVKVSDTVSDEMGAGDLLAANNLSDVSSAPTSRTNLGLGTAAVTAATDYATAAQGTTANSALQPSGNGSALTGLTKAQVSLGNVDNTSDASKPVSTATQTALDGKQVSGSYATGTGTANGTNTGDQASIVGITGTLAQFNTALTGADFTSGGGTATGTNTGDQTITLTGNVTGTGTGSFAATIATAAVTLAKMADVATATVFYRKTAATGVPEVQTLATLKTDLALVKGDVGLGSVDNTTDAGKPVSTAQQTALDLKAALASPTFSGTPSLPTGTTATTQAAADNTTKLATTAFATTADNLKSTIAAPSFTGATLTLADAQDVVINATTGSKIGQSTSKIGFYGITPAVRPTAITQTYSTASATHANVTQLAAPAGGTGATAGAYDTAANRNLMITSVNAARTDIANVKQVLNQVIDQLQALGLLQ